MNELSLSEQDTILGLLRLGWSLRRIQRETGHRRETIARYGAAAGFLPAKPAKVATDPQAAVDPEVRTDPPPAEGDPPLPEAVPARRSRSNS